MGGPKEGAPEKKARPRLEFDGVHWFDGVGLAVGWRIRVENAREVGSGFRSAENGQRETSHLGEQRERRRDVANAATLVGAIHAVVVDHRRRRNAVVVHAAQ